VVEDLSSKYKVMSLNPSTAKQQQQKVSNELLALSGEMET
jgi:hypothetical protein